MTRYCINADVLVDAWTHVEAETLEDAREIARSLTVSDFELGDPLLVTIGEVERDE